MMANKILFIENGKLVEQGSHDNLIKKNGAYAKLSSVESCELFSFNLSLNIFASSIVG